MTQYLITKREKCERYEYYGAGHANCKTCDGTGNIDTPVDLLEVLAKVRWHTTVEKLPNGGELVQTHQFGDLTIEEGK